MIKEATIRAELYRVLKNVIKNTLWIGDYRVTSLDVEYPVNGEKADLIIFWRYAHSQTENPFLVIETKSRVKYPSRSLPKATEQAYSYTEKLHNRFFAVYDGWNFLLFDAISPYLIKLSNFHRMDESISKNLLAGLLEYASRRELSTLNLLPKVADGWSFEQTILSSVAKSIAGIMTPEQEDAWKLLKGQWLPIIQRDGEW